MTIKPIVSVDKGAATITFVHAEAAKLMSRTLELQQIVSDVFDCVERTYKPRGQYGARIALPNELISRISVAATMTTASTRFER